MSHKILGNPVVEATAKEAAKLKNFRALESTCCVDSNLVMAMAGHAGLYFEIR